VAVCSRRGRGFRVAPELKRLAMRGWRHVGPDRLAEWVMSAVLLSALVAYMLLGNFARYVADDYGIAVAVRLRGFWAQQIAAYQLSDGHFVATALYTAGTLLNPAFVRILPAVLIIAWVALVTLAQRHVVPSTGHLGRLLISAGIVYTTLQITPSPFLSFYWMTASLEFVVPLLVAAMLVWLISRPSRSGRRRMLIVALIGLLAFLAAGEAEIYTSAQCVALTAAVAIAMSRLSSSWRRKLPELGAALIGSLAGLAIELVSPGKALRSAIIARAAHVPRPSLLTLPAFTFGEMLHFLQGLLEAHWREMVVMALLAALIGMRSGALHRVVGKTALITVGIATFGAVVVLYAAMAPAALYYGALPPPWDQIIPVYMCVCALAALGWWSGRSLRAFIDLKWRRAKWSEWLRRGSAAGGSVIVSTIVVIGPIATLIAINHDLPAIQAYAATKDGEASAAAAAHAAGKASVTVPRLVMVNNLGIFSHTPYEDLMSDPHYWINEDEAAYYAIRSVGTSP
jgi:Family of unknown function (DUF6056)